MRVEPKHATIAENICVLNLYLKFPRSIMGVALLGHALNKKIVSDRNSFINTFMKVCEQWHMFLKICRLPCINDY